MAIEHHNNIDLTVRELLLGFKGVIRFVSTDESRPQLNVVHIAVNRKGLLNLASTNGHTLAIWSCKRAIAVTRRANVAFNIPRVTVKRIIADLETIHRADRAGAGVEDSIVRIDIDQRVFESQLGSVNLAAPEYDFPPFWKVAAKAPEEAHPRAYVSTRYVSDAMQALRDVFRVDREGQPIAHIAPGATATDPTTVTCPEGAAAPLHITIMPMRTDHTEAAKLPDMIKSVVTKPKSA